MRRILLSLAAVASLSLAACGPQTAGPAAPSEVANSTKLDEQLMLGAESLYTGANQLAGLALDVASLDAAQRSRLKKADNDAFAALLVARSAYKAGNSSGYFQAIARLTEAVQQINAIVGSR